ncbi:hypothetical protein B0T16DRAFT_462140 [Cercophora newfieldiana]|uniref:Uncharacterized protein n=1 Tax=Cercophora newfieldiana TaxID=92897 RepID=A0AA39XXL4_9PEZI|nr:hypothetical protein B0T16DRAFT_462140 [Cercophora newfieldiana]
MDGMDTVSPAQGSPLGITSQTVPLLFSGMDRVCPCPGHTAYPAQMQTQLPSDLEMHIVVGCGAAAAAATTAGEEISLDDGSCKIPDGDSRSGYYTALLGFDRADWDATTDAYYGDDWRSVGASDVEELDTASVEVSVDEDDLALREAEVTAGTGRR